MKCIITILAPHFDDEFLGCQVGIGDVRTAYPSDKPKNGKRRILYLRKDFLS